MTKYCYNNNHKRNREERFLLLTKGFTLIELLAVIAIIAILASIVLVSFRRFAPTYKLGQEAGRIVQDLRLAQQKTVTEQITHLVLFDQDGNRYFLIRLMPDPELPGEYISEILKTEILDADIQIQELQDLEEPEIRFTTVGGAADAGKIVLANRYDETKTIDVRPAGFISY